ncbi:hypothetical protein LOB10_02140 [Lactobacillus delbrueckii subsp. lactis]|uniref:hypothetical protein n=1 Tax=Lactobacillus delbrueckii TaxID=1584 RepID=UPI001E3D4465|nr:hypothetical protein [Lactobacillus delbrueckii]MCD5528889.1 hypothetical protein [Lactobacillus delbrueckii subsp. lactis]
MTKVLPIVVSLIASYFSFSLSRSKSDQEKARDQYNRLNDECEKVTQERDKYYDEIKRLNRENLNLKKKLLLHDSEKQQREAENDS